MYASLHHRFAKVGLHEASGSRPPFKVHINVMLSFFFSGTDHTMFGTRPPMTHIQPCICIMQKENAWEPRQWQAKNVRMHFYLHGHVHVKLYNSTYACMYLCIHITQQLCTCEDTICVYELSIHSQSVSIMACVRTVCMYVYIYIYA